MILLSTVFVSATTLRLTVNNVSARIGRPWP
jgi:hypothetical protein